MFRLAEEVDQPLLISVTNTGKAPDQECESANNISKCSLLLKLFLAITIIGGFIVFLALIIWITPIPPTVHVHSMQISLNDYNLPIWSATFSIKNPNEKLHVKYENPSVWVFHRRRLVWRVRVVSFRQKGREENEVVVKGDETGVIDEAAAREVAVMGRVGCLDMVFVGRVGFYPATSAFWGEQNMTAVCENVRAKWSVINDGDIIYGTTRSSVLSFDGRRDCRVRLPVFP